MRFLSRQPAQMFILRAARNESGERSDVSFQFDMASQQQLQAYPTISRSNFHCSPLQSAPTLAARHDLRAASRRQIPNIRIVFAVEQLHYDPSVRTFPPAAFAVNDDSEELDSTQHSCSFVSIRGSKFQHRESGRVTIHFLNSILDDQPRITHVKILNPFLGKNTEDDKLSVLDILATDEHGRMLNIEMQTTLALELKQRLAYYASYLYVGQRNAGRIFLRMLSN